MAEKKEMLKTEEREEEEVAVWKVESARLGALYRLEERGGR